MLDVFLEVVLPVALVAVIGGFVGRWRGVSVLPVSALAFYLFTPALVFHSMAHTTMPARLSVDILVVMIASFVAMYVAATAWSTFRRHDAPMRAGVALSATTPNVGNMGLPVAFLAFGSEGLDIAVMNLVLGAIVANSLGIMVASMAGGSPRAALLAPIRTPTIYAALIGLAVNAGDVSLPTAIDSPAETLAAAAVPVMLVVLGLQLQQAMGRDDLLDTASVNAGRLVIAPVVAWFTATAIGMDDLPRATVTVLAAMPTAVLATILATEFRAVPIFVTRVVVTSTLLSMVSLTVLIALVQ